MYKMEDLIDFNCSPKVKSKESDHFPLLVPTKLSLTQNENPVSLPPKENNFNKYNSDTVDKSIDFLFDPFELQLEEKSFCLDIRNSIDTENFLIFDQEKLKSSSDPYTNKSIDSKLEKGKENLDFVSENIFKSLEIHPESPDLVNEKCDAVGTLTKLNNDNEGILIDLDDKLINTGFSDTDSNISTPNSEKCSNRLKQSKSEMKNRLLKLSLSNALIQSPLSRRCSIEDGTSPESSIFNEAAKLAKQLSQMRLNSSSPKKTADDSCDNIMEINPKWIDSESDISRDLELLKIPMLEKIDDDDKQNENLARENEKLKTTPEKNYFTKYTNQKTVSQRLIDINNFREKLKQHNLNSNCNNSNESIDSLISNLKDYVVHCGTNPTKKGEAEKLLDNLSHLLKDKEVEKNEIFHEKNIEKAQDSETKALALPPKPIIRQGTFDIDLENNKCNANDDEEPDFSENAEQSDEKTTSISPTQPDNLSDIVEQISKLVGGVQNINVLQTNSAASNISNPTYIVVMSTPGKNVLNHSNINVKRDEFSQSPDQKQFRRRSYSLTLPSKNVNKNEKQALSPSKEFNSFKTPIQNRYLNRRNSISSTTPQRYTNNLTARRSICKNSSSSNKTVKSPIPAVLATQKLEFNTTEMTKNRQCMINLPNDINSKRIRLKSRESVNNKGPLKATVQMKSVPPIQKPDIKKTSALHINSFSMNNSKSLIKNPPIACSTPMVGSPKKSPINGKKNSRFSTTPNSRRSSNLLSVAGNFLTNRRKSFSDTSFKTAGKPALGTNSSRTMKKAFENPISINKVKVTPPRLQTTQLKKENKDPKK